MNLSINNDLYDDFITITRKKKIRNKTNSVNNILLIDDIKNNTLFTELLKKYNPYMVLLYGSTARKQNKEHSDIDLMFIWKNNQIKYNFEDIKNQIKNIFSKNVDMINLIYISNKYKKYINHNDSFDCFLNNIYIDAISIYGIIDKDIIYSCTQLNNIYI